MSEKNTQIFREKSLQRVSSPEDLDKYIKTTTPSLWLLLASIVVLLVGVIAWGVLGKIEVKNDVGVSVNGGKGVSYIQEASYDKISDKTFIKCEDKEYKIDKVEGPYEFDETSDAYLAHGANLVDGDWYYIAKYNTDLQNGDFKGSVVFETISPISFIIN